MHTHGGMSRASMKEIDGGGGKVTVMGLDFQIGIYGEGVPLP